MRKSATGRKLLPLLLCVFLIATMSAPAGAFAETGDSIAKSSTIVKAVKSGRVSPMATYGWYDGHESDTSYTLRTNEDMQGLAAIVNTEQANFAGKTITLANDLTNLEIQPIGTKDYPFAGTFDGNGKILSNLKVTPQSKSYIGLFGHTSPASLIKGVKLSGGVLTVAETSTASGVQIRYVGGIAGYAGGGIEDCTSSMDIRVTSNLVMNKTMGIMRDIGGMAGFILGDMKNCTHSGDIYMTSDSNVNDDVRFIAGEIGGIAGAQGDVNDPEKLPVTENCVNQGDFIFNFTGHGGKDRFGEEKYPISFAAGGIVGQASGIVKGCKNSGNIATTNTEDVNGSLKYEAGLGADKAGGIVGDLRGDTFETINEAAGGNTSEKNPGFNYYISHGGVAGAPTSYPPVAGIYDCENTGDVAGLAAVGGIVGNSGSFTELEACANAGDVRGCRWNKPFAGGIGGKVMSNVRYCSNRGDIYSVAGAGYYCTGLVSGLWSLNNNFTKENDIVPTIEMAGCYTTGTIYTSSPGYRTAFLVGENDGYVHDNVYLMTAKDSNVIWADSGSTANNTELQSNSELKGSKGIALLNAYAAKGYRWKTFYLPATSNTENKGFPLLSHVFRTVGTGTDIQTYVNGNANRSPVVTSAAVYSTTMDPSPTVVITGLTQNADYYIVPQTGTQGVLPGATTYQATIKGMGKYSGQLTATIPYTIGKAKVADCTVIAAKTTFNWEVQSPTWVKLIDGSGNEVPTSEYTWDTLFDPANPDKKDDVNYVTKEHTYYDYKNTHGDAHKYHVKVTASPTSTCYTGETTQRAFRIMRKSLVESEPAESAVKYDKVVWGAEEWDFATALKDTSGNTIKITYTGKRIEPRVKHITYLGRELTAYQDQSPGASTDIMYVYGNPNPPENGNVQAIISAGSINVSPPDLPCCMTVRFNGTSSRFSNFINVFFRIVPAEIVAAKAAPVSDLSYTGKALTPGVSLTYNGMTLVAGKDYTLSYKDNTAVGRAEITVTGKGNYIGVKTLYFNINESTGADTDTDTGGNTPIPGDKVNAASIAGAAAAVVKAQTYTGKALTPAVALTYGGAKLTAGTDYILTYENNILPGKAAVKVTGKGKYAGEKILYFTINPAKANIKSLAPGKGKLTVKYAKPAAAQKATGLTLRYRIKGSSKWKTVNLSAGKSSYVIKKLKKGKKYQVQLRIVRTISSGAAKGVYTGAWSAVKTSKAIK